MFILTTCSCQPNKKSKTFFKKPLIQKLSVKLHKKKTPVKVTYMAYPNGNTKVTIKWWMHTIVKCVLFTVSIFSVDNMMAQFCAHHFGESPAAKYDAR
jgi:hypothetical protein